MASNPLQESNPSQDYCFQDIFHKIPWALKEKLVMKVGESGEDIWIREFLCGHFKVEGLKQFFHRVQRPDLVEITHHFQTKVCPVPCVLEEAYEQGDHVESDVTSVIPPFHTHSLQTQNYGCFEDEVPSLLDGYGTVHEQNVEETAALSSGIDSIGGIEPAFIQRHSVDGSLKHFLDHGGNSLVSFSQQHLVVPQTKLPVESETSDSRDALDPPLPEPVNQLWLTQLQRVEFEVQKLSKQSARNFKILMHKYYDLRKELDHHFAKLQGAVRGPVCSQLKIKGAKSSSCSRQDKELMNKSLKAESTAVSLTNVSTQTNLPNLPVEFGTSDTANRLDPSLPGQVNQLWLPQLRGVELELQKLSKEIARNFKIVMREYCELRKELDHQFLKLQGAVSGPVHSQLKIRGAKSSSHSRSRVVNKGMKKTKKAKWTESSPSDDGGHASSEASQSL